MRFVQMCLVPLHKALRRPRKLIQRIAPAAAVPTSTALEALEAGETANGIVALMRRGMARTVVVRAPEIAVFVDVAGLFETQIERRLIWIDDIDLMLSI